MRMWTGYLVENPTMANILGDNRQKEIYRTQEHAIFKNRSTLWRRHS